MSEIVTSAPGRICLFGEHQDYLGLPVIAMAINLRFSIEYRPGPDQTFVIETPDLDQVEPPLQADTSKPRFENDFLWGALEVLKQEGFTFPNAGTVRLSSQIPVRAGCSSSSAMTAAFMRLLLEIGQHSDRSRFLENRELMAHLTYRAEKELFGGAGGMMDQYSCYLGGLLHVYPDESAAAYGVESLLQEPEGFLLIDSGVPKDTQGVLRKASDRARAAIGEVSSAFSDFDLRTTAHAALVRMSADRSGPTSDALQMALEQIKNRDLCQEALPMLRSGISTPAKQKRLGEMLNEEHRILAQTLGISTPRIDELCHVALESGALGAKINGSGGGGTAFCYAPDALDAVESALAREGVRTFRVRAADGARRDRKAD